MVLKQQASLHVKRGRFPFLEQFFNFKIIIDSQEVVKIAQSTLVCPSPSFPKGDISYKGHASSEAGNRLAQDNELDSFLFKN